MSTLAIAELQKKLREQGVKFPSATPQTEGGILGMFDPGPAAGFTSAATGIGNPETVSLLGSLMGAGPEDLIKLAGLVGIVVTPGMRKALKGKGNKEAKAVQSGLRGQLANALQNIKNAFIPRSPMRKNIFDELGEGLFATELPPEKMENALGILNRGIPEAEKATGFNLGSTMNFDERFPINLTAPHEFGHLGEFGDEQKMRNAMQKGLASGVITPHPDIGMRSTARETASENLAEWLAEYVSGKGEGVPNDVKDFFRNFGGKFQSGGQVPQSLEDIIINFISGNNQ